MAQKAAILRSRRFKMKHTVNFDSSSKKQSTTTFYESFHFRLMQEKSRPIS
jgi:hypothetical protein